jgi:hypothetical protein
MLDVGTLRATALGAAEPARAVKVTVLSTMLAGDPGRGIGEWGFATLLEVDGQRLLIDAQTLEAPRPEVERLHVELERVREKAILDLQVLRIEDRPFGPDNGLEYRHGTQRNRIGAAEQSHGAN